VLGVVTYIAVTMIDVVIGRGYISWCRSHADYCTGRMLDFALYVRFPVRMFMPAVWAMWASVGMFRCGVRILSRSSAAKARFSGGAAVGAAIVLAVWMGQAVTSFVRGERYLVEAQACGADDVSGSPQCAAYRADTEEMIKEVEARVVKKGDACAAEANASKCKAEFQKLRQALSEAEEQERKAQQPGHVPGKP
jgi:hypothetical protein